MVYTSDMATRLFEHRYTYPDVVIACDGQGVTSRERTELERPLVVFEVLSESTERYDRGRKWDDYRQCESLQEYVLVGTEYQRVRGLPPYGAGLGFVPDLWSRRSGGTDQHHCALPGCGAIPAN